MSKKIISALLIGVLSITSLLGCSNKDEKDNNETITAINSENKYDNLNGEWATDFKKGASTGLSNVLKVFTDWISDLGTKVFDKLFGWISSAITKIGNLSSQTACQTL